jgi:hypothetical protein
MPFDNLPQPNRVTILLRRVKNRIRHEHNWTRGYFFIDNPPRECVVQAIMMACERAARTDKPNHAETQLTRMLAASLPLRYRLLPVNPARKLILYNDMPGRKHIDVINLLDRAITRSESRA